MIIYYALRITHYILRMEKMSLSVIMPALNEENDIRAAVENTLQAFDDFQVEGEIIVVNDGSTD